MKCPYLKKKGEMQYFCHYYYKMLNTLKGMLFCSTALCEQCPAFSTYDREYEKKTVKSEQD